MNHWERALVWTESCLAVVSALLAVVTTVWPTWMESLFQVNPDRGTGAAEWWLVLLLLAGALGLSAMARWQVRRWSSGAAADDAA